METFTSRADLLPSAVFLHVPVPETSQTKTIGLDKFYSFRVQHFLKIVAFFQIVGVLT